MPQQGTYDFPDAIRGDTYGEVEFTVLVNGAPLDLTGSTIRMSLAQDCLVRKKFTTDNGYLVITNAVAGIFTTNFGVIDYLKVADYEYDIEITLQNGSIHTWVKGDFSVIDDKTK